MSRFSAITSKWAPAPLQLQVRINAFGRSQISGAHILFALALALGALACGDDSAATCPAELAGNSAEWTALGTDSECVELAGTLNEGVDLSGDDSGCSDSWELQRRGEACTATLESRCDGIALELSCDVRSSGAADCNATVTAAELASGVCRFKLAVR